MYSHFYLYEVILLLYLVCTAEFILSYRFIYFSTCTSNIIYNIEIQVMQSKLRYMYV